MTQTITHTEELGGRTYYVLASEGLPALGLRGDSEGRIWRFTGTATAPKEELYLDPAALTHAPFSSGLGAFPDSVVERGGDALLREDRIFVRGLGLVQSEARLMSGSSGGFASGQYLVEARLDGIHLSIPAARLSLSVENNLLDVTGKKVTNCAVPSYCVACGLIGADPPGTYKPCAQARVESHASTAYTLELELANAAGQVVFRAPQSAGDPGALLRYVQLRLYSAPNAPLPPGPYLVLTRLKSGTDVLATSSIALQIF